MASEDRFGYEWNKYKKILPNYELQFINWISPLTKKEFYNKNVLDAGCGMGRNSYWVALYGAKKVIGFDYNMLSINVAKENLKIFNNVEILYDSIYKINYKEEFDIVFSIGVIHHLQYPSEAIKKLIQATRSGGRILIWVYSYEGNEWITKYINPIRKNITSKLPVQIVHYISYIISIPLFFYIKYFFGSSKYLKQLSKFSLPHIHSIVFDQLIPEIAHYWRKDEVLDLFSHQSLSDIDVIKPGNGMGWVATGIKK